VDQDTALKTLGEFRVIRNMPDGSVMVEVLEDACRYIITAEGEVFIEKECSCAELSEKLGVLGV